MRRFKALSAIAAVSLVLAACGDDDEPETTPDETEEPAGEDETEAPEEPMTVATDVGVTEEACTDAVNPDNGCIYLGTLTDLTGPFAGFGIPLTASQAAFWARVNEMGGITAEGFDQAYDVDVTTYNQSSGYDATEHARLYEEMEPNVLGLAQTLGTPTTQAILDSLKANNVLSVPAGYTSLFNFEDVVLESTANYCVETMNSVDYAVDAYGVESVMSVYYEGDYGGDAAAGAQNAAEFNELEHTLVPTTPGVENQAEAIGAIVQASPDLVTLTVGPAETAAIVGQAAAAGFTGRFIGTNPTWNPALLGTEAAPALQGLYEVGGTFYEWDADTPGHNAMHEALGTPDDVNDGYTIGWIWQYPLKAGLEAALANGDLTREGLVTAANSLETVDYEGMIPPEAGNYAGGPDAQIRQSRVNAVDPESTTGISVVQDFFTGPTAEAWAPAVCYEGLG
jgi:ABC-type branched-subunit amino acid transport system substrate-binding protein